MRNAFYAQLTLLRAPALALRVRVLWWFDTHLRLILAAYEDNSSQAIKKDDRILSSPIAMLAAGIGSMLWF
jgi:hypothetical protein